LLAVAVCVAPVAAFAQAAQVTTLATGYNTPQYVTVNGDKTVFVTDTTYALSALFLVNGAYTTTPMAYDTNFDGQFNSPQGVGVDQGGDIFATTNLNASSIGLWEFRPPDYSNVFAVSTSNDGGAAHGVAIDSQGNFFVAISNAAVFKLPPPSYGFAIPIAVGQSGVDHPFGIAFDSHDNLFVADQLASSGQILQLTAASGYATVNAITSGNLQQPVGVAVDSRGNLYVTDRALNTLTELLAPDYTTAAVIDSRDFSAPSGVALDADDNIFIVDTGHNALKEILAQPAVTGLTPTAGPLSGGNTVTITGVHLTGATTVSFGASAAASFTVVSDTQVTATAPAGSGTVDVRVTTPNGTSVAAPADKYTYTSGATVSALNPNSGPTAGGNVVTITGANLSNASAVSFGVTPATSFSVVGPTQISAVAPPGTAETVDVTVTTPGGTSPTGTSDHYTYVAAPTVSGLSPNAGSAGGGTGVTITGTNFTGATAVHFGVASATNVSVVGATSITATSPAGNGTVDVTVTTAGGTSATTSADAFTFAGAPAVTAIAPASGPGGGGTLVTITGSGFTDATAVNFGARAAGFFNVTSDTRIVARSPAGSGPVDVTVTTAGGTSVTSAADEFTYIPQPAVTAISPNSGVPSGGTTVTITGSNFTGVTAVRFGSAAATSVMVNSVTQITATSPAGSGTVDVTVTAPGGTSPTSSADKFSYGFARTWVSGTGDDTSQCTAGAPCQTFAAAMALTLPGGEIDALDPGDFGPVTITKSLSIVGGQDVVAAVSLASGGTSGVTVAAGADDVIELRGLIFDGFAGTGASGVVFTTGAKLNIEGCTFLGFPVGAITFSPGAGSAATAKMFVGGSNIFASGTGVVISPNAGIAADAWLIDANVDGNSGDGVVADGTGGGGPINVVMTNASIGPNAGNGVNAMSGAGSVAIDISRSTIEANGLAGIRSNGASANVTADRSQVSANGVGLQSAGGGSLLTYSNNQVMDNGTNGSFTGTIGLH
jgi:hypothetical protein